jgi:hypothetical protein
MNNVTKRNLVERQSRFVWYGYEIWTMKRRDVRLKDSGYEICETHSRLEFIRPQYK